MFLLIEFYCMMQWVLQIWNAHCIIQCNLIERNFCFMGTWQTIQRKQATLMQHIPMDAIMYVSTLQWLS